MNIFTTLGQTLYPEVCPFCLNPCKEGICPKCREEIEKLMVREPTCLCCGKPITDTQKEFCHDCETHPHIFTRGVSLWLHKDPVKRSIYRFKYENERAFGELYAREAVKAYGDFFKRWQVQVLVPVPLHQSRQRERGYNQAEIFARAVGERLQLPVSSEAVTRTRETSAQKNLGKQGRRRNLAGAFLAAPAPVGLRNVLVVDDIYTTGSTIDGVAQALKSAGVEKIYFLTISIGQGY